MTREAKLACCAWIRYLDELLAGGPSVQESMAESCEHLNRLELEERAEHLRWRGELASKLGQVLCAACPEIGIDPDCCDPPRAQ